MRQSIDLEGFGRIEVKGHLGYLRDADRKLTIDDVKHLTFAATNSESAPNIAFDRSAHWFKIDIHQQVGNNPMVTGNCVCAAGSN